jgi:hypothetical protein
MASWSDLTQSRTRLLHWMAGLPLNQLLNLLDPPPLSRSVNRDMKLQTILLGWNFLTKPCVSPQVFHGSMRLTGCGWVATTVRGVEPSRKCIKPGSLKLGES